MPGEAELSRFYPPDYHSLTPQRTLASMRHLLRWRSLAHRLDGPGAVLDYGCGDGGFLRFAAARAGGRRFWGYELADAASFERDADGSVTILRGSAEKLYADLPECRLVTMNHVIEHLPRPDDTLLRLRSRIAPGGWLTGQTPAADSLEHRFFGTFWSGYHAPRHTVVFSPVGLKRVLERAGFSSVRVRGAFNPAAAAVSVGSLFAGDRPGRIRRSGVPWLALLAAGTAFAPVDLVSRRPGIVNFEARMQAA
jgi:SAM-dependent methyltransferase